MHEQRPPGVTVAPVPDPTMEGPPAPPRTRRDHLAAVAGYLFLTAVFFWPAFRHLPTRMLSDSGDGSLYTWNLWAIPRSLLDFESPFSTDLLLHPLGADTAFNTNMPFWAVASAPLQWLFGLVVAVNLLQIFAVVASGFGTYLLVRHVGGDPRAAFVAGAAFAFVPYRLGHYSQFSLNHTEVLPFGILALLRLYEHPSRGRALALGAVAGITFLTDLYYTVFLGLAGVVVAAWHWRRTLTRVMGLRLAQAGLVAGIIGLPLAVAMVRGADALDPVTNWANADNYNSDLLSWVTPSQHQWIWSDRFVDVNVNTTGGERLAFPGYVLLGLAGTGAVVGLWRRRQRVGLWLTLFGTFFVLSLGPFLRVDGTQGDRFSRYGIRFDYPLPYYVVNMVPVLNGVRVPGRFSIMAVLALCVLAGGALTWLARLRPKWGWAVPAVALALIAIEFYPGRLQTTAGQIPDAYEVLADEPGSAALLEVPLQWRTGFGAFGDQLADHNIFMYWATHHGKPLVGGMVARYPEERIRDIATIGVYAQVIALQDPEPGPDAPPPTFTADDLVDLGIGYVAYHRDRPRPRAEEYLARLGLPVLADDGTVIIWKVPPAA